MHNLTIDCLQGSLKMFEFLEEFIFIEKINETGVREEFPGYCAANSD